MGWRWGPSVRVCVRVVRARSRAFVPECMRRPSESRGPRQRRRGQDGDDERETHMRPVQQGARARARGGVRVCVCEVHAEARARSCVGVCRADPVRRPKTSRRQVRQRRCSAASPAAALQGPKLRPRRPAAAEAVLRARPSESVRVRRRH